VDREVGGKFKSVWGNLKAVTEKGEIKKIYISNKKGSFGIKTIQKHLR